MIIYVPGRVVYLIAMYLKGSVQMMAWIVNALRAKGMDWLIRGSIVINALRAKRMILMVADMLN